MPNYSISALVEVLKRFKEGQTLTEISKAMNTTWPTAQRRLKAAQELEAAFKEETK